jgi:hypothetical protein
MVSLGRSAPWDGWTTGVLCTLFVLSSACVGYRTPLDDGQAPDAGEQSDSSRPSDASDALEETAGVVLVGRIRSEGTFHAMNPVNESGQ